MQIPVLPSGSRFSRLFSQPITALLTKELANVANLQNPASSVFGPPPSALTGFRHKAVSTALCCTQQTYTLG